MRYLKQLLRFVNRTWQMIHEVLKHTSVQITVGGSLGYMDAAPNFQGRELYFHTQ